MVVEVKSFAVVGCIRKLGLRYMHLSEECSKEATPHAANATVGRSLALFVHLSAPNTYLSTNSHVVLEDASRWSSGLPHRCLWTCRTSLRVVADAIPAEEAHTLFQPTSVERPP